MLILTSLLTQFLLCNQNYCIEVYILIIYIYIQQYFVVEHHWKKNIWPRGDSNMYVWYVNYWYIYDICLCLIRVLMLVYSFIYPNSSYFFVRCIRMILLGTSVGCFAILTTVVLFRIIFACVDFCCSVRLVFICFFVRYQRLGCQ